MPIFEYQCQECGHDFELLILGPRSKDDDKCPKCHDTNILKKISLFVANTDGKTNDSPFFGGGGFDIDAFL